MPRIEPIPLDQLSPESRQIIEEGFGDGLYSTQMPLQIFAYRAPSWPASTRPAPAGAGARCWAGGSSS